ncbi:hypothetical protein Bbelb_241210 [Branchiostoma belcheri]|nr:hypothetical protein Bbelb_241210 [Branchiostoma belcheri]
MGPRLVRQQTHHKSHRTCSHNARGEDGELLFETSEWRSAKQISSYFARLSAAQRRQESPDSHVTHEDIESLEVEAEWQTLRGRATHEMTTLSHVLSLLSLLPVSWKALTIDHFLVRYSSTQTLSVCWTQIINIA